MRSLIARLFLALALCAAPIVTTGCSKTAVVQHPGAINASDSAIYETLVLAHDGIAAASVQFASNPKAIPLLNIMRHTYDKIDRAYKVYHSAGMANAAAEADLKRQITALSADVKALPQKVAP